MASDSSTAKPKTADSKSPKPTRNFLLENMTIQIKGNRRKSTVERKKVRSEKGRTIPSPRKPHVPEETNVLEILKIDRCTQINDLDLTSPGLEAGDMLLEPSLYVKAEIAESRRKLHEEELKLMLAQKRQFDESSRGLESHLSNLREFLDKGSVSRRDKEAEQTEIEEILNLNEKKKNLKTMMSYPRCGAFETRTKIGSGDNFFVLFDPKDRRKSK